jgi:hypothetical protein
MNNSYRKTRKNKKQKGGNIVFELDELKDLGRPAYMEAPGAYNRLENQYEKILREIPNANEDELIETNNEINRMMTSDPDDDEDDFIPIDHYHEALRPKLEDIQNKIRERIDFVGHIGGKKKINYRKKRTRRRKGGKRKTRKTKKNIGKEDFGTWRDGSSIFKDKKGFYVVQWNIKKKMEYKKYLKNWKPKSQKKRLVLKKNKWHIKKSKRSKK